MTLHAHETATEPQSASPSTSRSAGAAGILRHLGGAVATFGALCGATVLLWLLLAPLLGLSLVVFATGSMAPTIPQGALALARSVPADGLAVGDVAMLRRPGQPPVSHRIESIAPDPTSSSARLVTMRGDANPVSDPEPYRVTEGRVVLAAIPGGAAWFAVLRSPVTMGMLTALAAVVVLRAFWPRGLPGRHR